MLKTSDFNYHLPEKFIAQTPAIPRDSAKLMLVNRQTGQISHHHVRDLPQLLPKTYTLVVNNTKVFPARLKGHKPTGGQVEVLLLEKKSSNTYLAITKPGLKPQQQVIFSPKLKATCLTVNGYQRTLQFSLSANQLNLALHQLGETPTPPYIKQMVSDPQLYQTVYAKYGFSAAAPTAGLHFTKPLFNQLKHSHGIHELTLNIGLGTFLPVKTEDFTQHQMHSEHYTITAKLAQSLNQLKQAGKKILAIGTTTTRALESAVNKNGELTAQSAYTDIFIYPPYQFKFVDALLTNFHLPKSTLLMMVAAFTSWPNTSNQFKSYHQSLIGQAYEEAKKHNYRFFSFGDAMLIL